GNALPPSASYAPQERTVTSRLVSITIALGLALLVLLRLTYSPSADAPPAPQQLADIDRSPVDLVVTADGRRLLTANQTSATVSLVDVASGKVLPDFPCGKRPSALALSPDEKTVLVSGTFSGDVTLLSLAGDQLQKLAVISLGFWVPRGVAVSPDGRLAYVALTTAHEV